MSLKYGALNFLILILALFFTLKNYEVWTQPIKKEPEKEAVKEVKNKPEAFSNLDKENTPVFINSSILIAERNIFNPERKDFSTTTRGQTNKPMARPQIILYGVAITPDYQSASVLNPGPLHKGERETKTIKVGDQMGGYKLAKILPDRITMEAPGDSFDVLLYDPMAPKKRGETRIAEARTVQPSAVATAAEIQKPGPQEAGVVTKEPIREELAPPRPTLSQGRGAPFPNRSAAIQSRAALISRPDASKK